MSFKKITVFVKSERISHFDEFKNNSPSDVNWDFLSPETEEDFALQIDMARSMSLSIRLDSSYINWAEKHIKESSREVLKLMAADAFLSLRDHLWPHIFLVSAITKKISQEVKNLDLSGAALIIGKGSIVRACLEAAVKMGFRKINWVSESNEAEVKKWLKTFNNYYFGIEFNHLEPQQLTMLPGNSSVVIMHLDLNSKTQLINDLSYFNFVKKEAVIINLYASEEKGPAMKEAKEIGLRVIEADLIYALSNKLWWRETEKLLNEKPDKSLVTKNVTE